MKIAAWMILPICLSTQGTVYKDARYGFSIEAPAFAAAEAASVTPVMFFAAPENGFAANVNVSVQTTPMTAKEYAELSREQFQQMKFEVVSEKELKVSGRDALLWDYRGRAQGLDLHWLALAVADKGRVFLVTATSTADAFPKHEKAFHAALRTFSLPE